MQAGVACGQRGANRQPAGGLVRSGNEPGMLLIRVFGPPMRGTEAISACE
jgi:hypothetical protein